MLFPIKPKNSNLLSLIIKKQKTLKGLFSKDQKLFNDSLSTVRIGRTFKTSSFNRIPLITNYLTSLEQYFDVIYDIGCSDGSSSYNLLKSLKFGKYVLMDKYLYLFLYKEEDKIYLFDSLNNLHMYENKNYKIYLDPLKESKSFVEIIFNYFFKLEKKNKIKKNKILCINKKILELKKNIEYINYDLSNSLQEQKSNLMLVINLIDKFNDNKRTLLKFKNNIVNMIEENGILVIGENTKF